MMRKASPRLALKTRHWLPKSHRVAVGEDGGGAPKVACPPSASYFFCNAARPFVIATFATLVLSFDTAVILTAWPFTNGVDWVVGMGDTPSSGISLLSTGGRG